MKKVIFTGFVIALPMLAISLISHGQRYKSDLAVTNASSAETSASKAGNSLIRSNVASKAVRNFVSSYKDVSDEKWYNVTGGVVAMFTLNHISYQVDYDKKGNWLNTIRTYDESQLPPDVRHAVKSNYYDYNINLVQEIETPYNPKTYLIQLIGKTEIISLRICEEEMSVVKEYNKSE